MTLWEYSNTILKTFTYKVNDMVYVECSDDAGIPYFTGIGLVHKIEKSPIEPSGDNITIYSLGGKQYTLAVNVRRFHGDLCIPLERYGESI